MAEFIGLMARVVPDLATLVPAITSPDQLSQLLSSKLEWFDSPEEAQTSSFSMLIRKQDFKMYKYDTRSKNVEKVFAHCPDDYLDPLDREMLILRH